MKTALLLSLFIGLPFAHGQGTIRFTNMGLDAPVRSANGELVPASNLYVAWLLAGATPHSLSPLTGTESFSSPGEFGGLESIRVVPGMEPGSHPWFLVQCWRRQSGLIIYPPHSVILEIGESAVFQLDPAGPGLGETADDAPDLRGLTPFQLRLAVTLSVALEEGNVVVRWEADPRLPLYLERATSVAGTWAVLSNAVSPYAEPTGSGSPVYFRVVAIGEGLQANQAVEATQPRSEVPNDQ